MNSANPRMFIEFTPAMRVLIEDAIEALLLLLDEIDGDMDLEDGSDNEEEPDREPSLSASNFVDQILWGCGGMDDREHDDEREPDEGVFYL